MTRLVLRSRPAKARAQLFRALRHVGKAIEQRAEVKPGANGEYRQLPATAQVLENADGHVTVSPRRRGLRRIKDVDQMMRNSPALPLARLCRTDIKAAIKLSGIAGNHLAPEPLRQKDRERSFAGGRRSENGDERVSG